MPVSGSSASPRGTVQAVVEVPRGSFIKRELHGERSRVSFVSPVPCPFNYGYLPRHEGADGDPLDAVVLGPALKTGELVERSVVGVVRFMDGGVVDDKLVLSDAPLSRRQRLALAAFFMVYARARRLMNLRPGARRGAAFLGVEPTG